MLETYFKTPFTLTRLRTGPFGHYIDGFAQQLEEKGYTKTTAQTYLRAGAHLGYFVDIKNIELAFIDATLLKDFQQHLPACQCPLSNGGKSEAVGRGARHFLGYLHSEGFADIAFFKQQDKQFPACIDGFRHWLIQHRGVSQSTLDKYSRGALDLINTLGPDTAHYNAQALREFLLMRAKQQGSGAAKTLVTALRIFLRYLASQGKCAAGLERAIPALASWRHTTLPAYLNAAEVQRIVDSCHSSTTMGLRDRAIILLLARLGLRAGDVAGLRLTDIDWADSSLLVSGKNSRETRLPLPQEVGDAILNYLNHRWPIEDNVVFLRALAPYRALRSGESISAIVTRAMHRAGVTSVRYGAHILRHSLATEMLRQGVSLYEIGAVLRHQSIDMTSYYTKVDVELLKLAVQPWPEVLR